MAEQLWKGRFSKAVDSRVNDFNSSIRFDQRMIAQDMRGSGVHAAMLAKQGIISEKDCEDILNGLASIADDLASGKLEIDPNAEDVHTFVEQTLTARIGDAGKRLHTGRSRNDQVALDIRLTLRDYSKMLQGRIVELVQVICKKAAENTTAVMPGYTHLQRAQPITFGHALMAYAWMLLRDLQRFEDATARMDAQCPLGSGALAGTTYPLDRDFTAEKLFWILDLMVFHVLAVLVVMELHADLIAALTPAVPVFTVWLMVAQLLLYACSTPLMELVMEVDSVVDRFSAAAVTRPVLVVMPFARPCMKSGIQLSISANGPSSGTEKCRKERIRSATPDTALATS